MNEYRECNETIAPRLREELKRVLVSQLPDWTKARGCGSITFGVEQEFFLTNQAGMPCSHDHSQRFFRILNGQNPEWQLREDADLDGLVSAATCGVGKDQAEIKYEHDPHLLEIASPVFTEISELDDFLRSVWATIDFAASKCGLEACHVPMLDNVNALELAQLTKSKFRQSLLLVCSPKVDPDVMRV